jgi:beta-lactamase regulating signal transducer with metallopeptidase domain
MHVSGVEAWLGYLLSAGLRGGVLLALAALAALLLRRQSASLRHLVWAAGLAGLGVVTALSWLLPDWQVALPAAPPVLVEFLGDAAARAPAPPAPTAPDRAAVAVLRPGPGAGGADSWLPAVALAVWAAGACWLLLRLLLGLRAAARLVRGSTAVPAGALRDMAGEVARRAGLGRPCDLRFELSIGSPVATGWVRPLVLLPADASNWPADRVRAVLAHEIGHVRRRDCLTQLLARVVTACHWWNPLAWLAERRMFVERERACDDYVLADGTRASDYARHLLDIGRLAQLRSAEPALRAAARSGALIAGCTSLTARVETMLDAGRSHRLPGRGLGPAVLCAALALALPAACLNGHPLQEQQAVRLVYKTADATRDATAGTLTRRLREMGLSSARVSIPDDDQTGSDRGRLLVELPRLAVAERARIRATMERRGIIALAVVAEHEDGPMVDIVLRQLAANAWGGHRDFRWLGVQAVSPYMRGDEDGIAHPVAVTVQGPRTGLLRYLALVPHPPQPYAVVLERAGGEQFKTVLVDRRRGLLLERVVDARVLPSSRPDPGAYEIQVTLAPEDAGRMLALTSANVGRKLAIELDDGEIWGAPRIRSPISTQVSITTRGARTEAENLAAALRAGSLPAPLIAISEKAL